MNRIAWAIIVGIALFAGSLNFAYSAGEDAANAKWAEKARQDAENNMQALQASLDRYREQVTNARKEGENLAQKNAELQQKTTTLKRQIKNAIANGNHAFSAEFVRLYNLATANGGVAVPAAAHSGGNDGAGTGSGAAGAGLLLDVTEADLLAHITDYGAFCQRLAAKEMAWIHLTKGWQNETPEKGNTP